MSSMLSDLLAALPAAKPQTVSLLDALPDPNQQTLSVDYETKASLLESNANAMSAAEEFAVLMHKKQRTAAGEVEGKQVKKRRTEALPKKTRERRNRGKEIRSRTRGNQRGVVISKKGA